MRPSLAAVAAAAVVAAVAGGSAVAPAAAPTAIPTIAFVDTGVAPLPAFAGRLVPGVDLVRGGPAAGDLNGHGTAMAAIAAGSEPRLAFTGVCPTCRVMPVVALGDGGSGFVGAASEGVRWAAAHGARVIVFAVTTDSDDPDLDAAIADATAGGAVVVIAAGNAGSTNPSNDGYPAASSPEAVTVAGAAGSALASWSNRGAWVQLAAPGTLTTLGADGKPLRISGSSVAAAYVGGLVGAMLSRRPSLTPAVVRATLETAGRVVAHLAVASGRIVSAPRTLAAVAALP